MNIEEKAREYDWQQELFNYMSNEHDVTMLNSDMHEVYMICQKDFTNATRWRKVEEELPELIKGNFYYVIGEHKNGTLEIETIANKNDIEYVNSNWDRWKKVY